MIPHECKWGRLNDFFDLAEDSGEYRELLQFFGMVGLKADNSVYFITGASGQDDQWKHGIEIEPGKRQLANDDWEIFVDTDDFSVAVYYEGQPKGGFYVSTRGSLYQAGCFIVDEDQYYWSNNIDREAGTWEKGETLSGEIAHEWIHDRN